jgi:hypothetical protein
MSIHLKSIEVFYRLLNLCKTHNPSLTSYHKTDSLSVYINGNSIPIGDTYKKELFEIIQKENYNGNFIIAV